MPEYENVNEVVRVTINNNEVDAKLLRYRRDQNICTGIAMLELTLVDNGTDYEPWDVVRVYEHGGLRGVFYVSVARRDANTGTYSMQCQDGSKKLIDYFISDSYTIEEYATTLDWIPVFLAEAGVSYSIGAIDDVPLSTNSQLGLMSAYDQILQLIQYSGAYMYFDYNGTCIIGSMNARGGGTLSLTNTNVTSFKSSLHDSMLRNRAVVWGNADPVTGEWVFADMSVITPYNYDGRDLRAVVLSNHNIATVSDAETMGRRLLNEFAQINHEFEISAAGLLDAHVGKWVRCASNFGNASGLITTCSHEVSEKGMTTSVILNERCPRMWAFWSSVTDYVYVGTAGEGVWRKPLDGSLWEDFNTSSSGVSLSGSYITDLYINNDEFVCIDSGGGAYYRAIESGWSHIVPSGISNVITSGVVATESLLAKACAINHTSNEVIVAYNHEVPFSGGWVVTFSGLQQNSAYQAYVQSGVLTSGYVTTSGDKEYAITILDIDTADAYNMLTVEVAGSGITYSGVGLLRTYPTVLDPEAHVTLPKPIQPDQVANFSWNTYFLNKLSFNSFSVLPPRSSVLGVITNQWLSNDRVYVYWFAQYYDNSGLNIHFRVYRSKYNVTLNSWTHEYIVITPTHPVNVNKVNTSSNFLYKDTDNDDIVYFVNLVATSPNKVEIIKVDFIEDTTTSILVYTQTYPTLASAISGNNVYTVYYQRNINDNICYDTFYMDIIDLYTGEYISKEIGTHEREVIDSAYPRYAPETGLSKVTKDCSLTPLSNGHVAFVCSYWITYWDCGFIYGSDTQDLTFKTVDESKMTDNTIFMTLFESSIPAPHSPVAGGDYSDVGAFLGRKQSKTYIGIKLGYHCYNADLSKEKMATFVRILSFDSSGSYSIVHQDEIRTGEYDTGDTVIEGTYFAVNIWGRALPISTKFKDSQVFLDKALLGDGSMRIASITDGTILSEFVFEANPSYIGLLAQRADDIDDQLYFIEGQTLYGYNLTGELRTTVTDVPVFNNELIDMHFANSMLIYRTDYFTYPTANYMIVKPMLAPTLNYWWNPLLASGSLCYVLKQTGEIFETVKVVSGEYVLDISNGTPTEIFVRSSGEGLGSTIYQTFEATTTTWSEINPQYPTYDMRSVRFVSISGTVASGVMDSPDGQYALAGSMNSIKGFPTSLSGSSITYAMFSGGVVQIETTRVMPDPYIFAAVSGTTTSGVSGWAFMQRNPGGANVFSTYTVPGAITIIRMDDQF